MKRLTLGVGALLLIFILVKVGISSGTHQTDQEQIQIALKDSIQASKEGKPGGVLDLIGSQITFNSEDASGQMGEVSKFIKNQRPDITIQDQTATITGNDAQISSPASLDISLLGQHRSINLKQVVLIFRKEPSTQWLVIPSQKWKLEQVQVPNFTPDQLAQ